MSREIRAFECLIPAGTAKTAPALFDLGMPARIVDQIDIRVPPGPNGVMGFRISSAGQQIIPYNAGAYVVASDEKITWPLTAQITSGAWQLMGYNSGQYDHTVYVKFLLSLPGTQAADTVPDLIPAADLAPPPDTQQPDLSPPEDMDTALTAAGGTGSGAGFETGA